MRRILHSMGDTLRTNWGGILLFEMIYRLFSTILIVETASHGTRFALEKAGFSYLTAKNALRFLASPITILVLLGLVLLTGSHTVIRQAMEHAARLQGLEVTPFLETESNGFILALVRQNMGISFLPEYRIRKAAQDHEIAVLPVSDFHLELYVNIYYHKNKYVTPQMAGLIQLVQEYWDRVSAEKRIQAKEES